MSKLFTPTEVAQIFNCSRSKVYELARTGELQSYILSKGKVQVTRRFSAEHIQNYLETGGAQ